MLNKIKHCQAPPTMWNKMWVRAIKKKNGSINDLNSYRGVFIGSIVSLIFEKVLNLRIILVASLRLKNERGERLSSHRSDHVTWVWGGLHNLCNVQRIFLTWVFKKFNSATVLCSSRYSLLASIRSILCWSFSLGVFRIGYGG